MSYFRSALFMICALLLINAGNGVMASAQVNRPYNNNGNNVNNNNLRLQVQRAIYGYNGKGNDVTNRVRSQIRNNQINMEVTNDTMGGDPNHGNKKNLKVMYTYGNNKSHTKYVNEKDWLRIP
jgi:hypothetical protein